MPESHDERVREAFTRQSSTFEDERLNVAFTSGLPWLLSLVAPRPEDTVLDVAAGTGLVGRALCPEVRWVTALDSTPAMIAEGRRRADIEGHRNITFVGGSVEHLPFDDDSFSLVVTRFSLHHFADPEPAVAEMVRVLGPGGRLVVKDLVADPDPAVAARQDHVERLRDDSHVRMPPRGVIGRWLADAGLLVSAVEEHDLDRPVEPWLEQSGTDPGRAAAVRSAFHADLAGREHTGLRPHEVDGELWFHQTWEVTVASRP